MKRLLTMMLFTASLLAGAEESRMHVSFASGEEQTLALAGIERLTFTDGKLTIAGTQEASYPLADIARLTFTLDTSGVGELSRPASYALHLQGESIIARGWHEGLTPGYALYDASGRLIAADAAWAGEPIAIGVLERGVYLLRTAETTLKFVK